MQTYYTYLFGDTTFEAIQNVVRDIDTANASDEYTTIHLTLSSGGGLYLPAFALHDQIKASKKEVTIEATGICQSSALLILQAGSKRSATKNTVFMMHKTAHEIERTAYEEFTKEVEQRKKENELFTQLTIDRSKISKEEFDKLTQNSLYFNSQEALTYGLIDEISNR